MMKNNIIVFTIVSILAFLLVNNAPPSNAQARKYLEYQILVQSQRGNADAVLNMLRNGADPNSPPAPNDKGMSALMFAAWKNNDTIVKMLVDFGADVNAVSSNGATPLAFALVNKNEPMARFLLEKGAKADSKVAGKTSILDYAFKLNNPQLLGFVSSRTPAEVLNKKIAGDDTLLFITIKRKQFDIVNALLEGSFNLEARDKLGQTALMYMARSGKIEIVKKMLDKGANPNAKDSNGFTARSKARFVKNRPIQRLLKSRGGKG